MFKIIFNKKEIKYLIFYSSFLKQKELKNRQMDNVKMLKEIPKLQEIISATNEWYKENLGGTYPILSVSVPNSWNSNGYDESLVTYSSSFPNIEDWVKKMIEEKSKHLTQASLEWKICAINGTPVALLQLEQYYLLPERFISKKYHISPVGSTVIRDRGKGNLEFYKDHEAALWGDFNYSFKVLFHHLMQQAFENQVDTGKASVNSQNAGEISVTNIDLNDITEE